MEEIAISKFKATCLAVHAGGSDHLPSRARNGSRAVPASRPRRPVSGGHGAGVWLTLVTADEQLLIGPPAASLGKPLKAGEF